MLNLVLSYSSSTLSSTCALPAVLSHLFIRVYIYIQNIYRIYISNIHRLYIYTQKYLQVNMLATLIYIQFYNILSIKQYLEKKLIKSLIIAITRYQYLRESRKNFERKDFLTRFWFCVCVCTQIDQLKCLDIFLINTKEVKVHKIIK